MPIVYCNTSTRTSIEQQSRQDKVIHITIYLKLDLYDFNNLQIHYIHKYTQTSIRYFIRHASVILPVGLVSNFKDVC